MKESDRRPAQPLRKHDPLQNGDEAHPDHVDEPLPPLRVILTKPVVLSIANHLWLAFLDVALLALHPLFFATPIRLGGLGMSPATIGLCLGFFGLLDGVAHGLFFPKIIRLVGLRKLFLTSVFCFVPMFAMFPIVNHFAREWGLSPAVWALILFHFVISSATEMGFGGCSLLDVVNASSHFPPYHLPQVACSYT